MPLTWGQLKTDLDPQRYTLRTVPVLLAKTKAWAGYEDASSSIKAAIAKLAGR
jgi:bifunctional non-homologous end joining protein LigD